MSDTDFASYVDHNKPDIIEASHSTNERRPTDPAAHDIFKRSYFCLGIV